MKNNTLCFIVKGEKIYLDCILVDYEHTPIFFVCRGVSGYYISLCTDLENLDYILVKVSNADLYQMLIGTISMRDTFLRQAEYFIIHTGEKINEDIVICQPINMIEEADLPDIGAYFNAITQEQSDYVSNKKFEFFIENMRTYKKHIPNENYWYEYPKYDIDKNEQNITEAETLGGLVA